MSAQGTYPIGSRTLSGTDTVTGVVTGSTADVPLTDLAAYVAATGTFAYAEETQTISVGQTVVNLLHTYSIGKPGALAVYADGLRLVKDVDYTETTSTSITLTAAAAYAYELTFVIGADVGVPSSALAALIASDGSSLVGHIAAGSGATYRLVQTKLRDLVSVKDFGAVGDGGTDDAAAFTSAAAASKVVIAPAGGTYLLNSNIPATGVHFIIYGTLTGVGKLTGATVSRYNGNSLAVGRNGNPSGAAWTGLQVGGGETSYGSEGVFMAPDGQASWLKFQPTKNESAIEVLVYPTAAQGIAQAQNATNQIVRTSGTSFTSSWVGKKFYFGSTIYKVATVTDANHLTVTTSGGGAVSFSSTFSETYHVCYVSGSGYCTVTGGTVARLYGDPFISFISSPYVFKLAGTAYTVSAFTDIDTQTISSPPANGTYAYTFETDINDQIATFRLQKMLGANEENLSVYARYDGYHIRSLYAGSGKYRKVWIGSGENSGTLYSQMVAQSNGDLTLGGDYGTDAIRVLAQTGAVANRLDTQAATTTFSPGWRARGTDTNVGMTFDTQGAGSFTYTSNSYGAIEFQIFGVGGTSWLSISSSASAVPILAANGAASNIDIRLAPKGSGYVWVGAWTANGDAAINGYVSVRDTSGNIRKLATIA